MWSVLRYLASHRFDVGNNCTAHLLPRRVALLLIVVETSTHAKMSNNVIHPIVYSLKKF